MEDVIAQLVAVLGKRRADPRVQTQAQALDERVAQKTARARRREAVRHLAALGFVDLAEDQLRLRPALLRFAEPVRGLSEPAEALMKLVARAR
jgi:chromosome partition protein MukE